MKDENEVKLLPRQSLIIQDSAGTNAIVGPLIYTTQAADVILIFNEETSMYRELTNPLDAIISSPVAREGEYIVLGNPVKSDHKKRPETGKKNPKVDLEEGTAVIIPGPATFDLFPGQWAKVIEGHRLNTNEYLRLRVIDAKKAKAHWGNAIIEIQADQSFSEKEESNQETKGWKAAFGNLLPRGKKKKSEDLPQNVSDANESPEFITGKEIIVKGTDISYFIPSTGIEVVKDDYGNYVRKAVTLQQGQYCILQYEDGAQVTVKGPTVVFPLTTQTFIEDDGKNIFNPIELDENSGVYVKVLQKSEFNNKSYEVGKELFITGKDEKFVYPRPGEWQIVKVRGQVVNHAAAIPPGQGRYVWDEEKNEVMLIEGPQTFLPDPRKQYFVTRSMPLHVVKLLFPNSKKALEVNEERGRKDKDLGMNLHSRMRERGILESVLERQEVYRGGSSDYIPNLSEDISGNPVKPVSFDNNFDGAVVIQLWTGFAIKAIDSKGNSRVEVGPKTVLLKFDEVVEILEFSTSTPKNHGNVIKDVFLKVNDNQVSDVVKATTKDNVEVELPLSYRLTFSGDQKKWFNVKNYVQLLTDHMRSFIGNVVKAHTIKELMENHRDIVRDAVLGGKPEDGGERKGRLFQENGMKIYDLELKNLEISDQEIEDALLEEQREVMDANLETDKSKRKVEQKKEKENVERQEEIEEAETKKVRKDLKVQAEKNERKVEMDILEDALARAKKEGELQELQNANKMVNMEAEVAREKVWSDKKHDDATKQLDLAIKEQQAKVNATKENAAAVTPELITALQNFSGTALTKDMVKELGKVSFTQGESVMQILKTVVEGLGLDGILGTLNKVEKQAKREEDGM
ncbi:hypothetical protein HOD29_02665 [archaeon]|jgi:major vault protein|nr:hypothetical protein [archaeon]